MPSMSWSSGTRVALLLAMVICFSISWHAQHALSDERALDLERAAVDGGRPAEQVLVARRDKWPNVDHTFWPYKR